MRRLLPFSTALLVLTACGGSTPPSAEACAEYCGDGGGEDIGEATEAAAPAATPDHSLSDFEHDLLRDAIQDVRAGVRPFSPESLGICKGKSKCEEFIGMDAGELPPGDYILHAEMRVPNAGEPGTWNVRYDIECTTTRKTSSGETTSTSSSNKEHVMRYSGEEHGYRWSPLRTITSPGKGGATSCTWKITAPHPDGDKVYEGAWSVPAAE